MIRLAALLALSLSACAAAAPEGASPGGPASRCDVTIRFGSYGGGIDRPLSDTVTDMVKTDRDLVVGDLVYFIKKDSAVGDAKCRAVPSGLALVYPSRQQQCHPSGDSADPGSRGAAGDGATGDHATFCRPAADDLKVPDCTLRCARCLRPLRLHPGSAGGRCHPCIR